MFFGDTLQECILCVEMEGSLGDHIFAGIGLRTQDMVESPSQCTYDSSVCSGLTTMLDDCNIGGNLARFPVAALDRAGIGDQDHTNCQNTAWVR